MELAVADIHEAIAATRPDQECLVVRDRRLTWAQVTERTRRLANHLVDAGLGVRVEREHLAGHESGQSHLAIYLHNGNEYLECMLGAFKARVAPFNVNYRYVAEELRYLLNDSLAEAVVVHSRFAPVLAEVLSELPRLRVILLPGAQWYEDALAAASPDKPAVHWSPDDLYILYTGGTTGMPKGVLWRNGDANVECFGGSRADTMEGVLAEANTLGIGPMGTGGRTTLLGIKIAAHCRLPVARSTAGSEWHQAGCGTGAGTCRARDR
jgi:fatty-acyl-CoA synthase